MKGFALSYCVLYFVVFGCCLLEVCTFLKGNAGGGGESEKEGKQKELGELGAGEPLVRDEFMREVFIFNKNK